MNKKDEFITTGSTWLAKCDLYLSHKKKSLLEQKHECESCQFSGYPSYTYLMSTAYDILLREYDYSLVVDRSLSECEQITYVKRIMQGKVDGGKR